MRCYDVARAEVKWVASGSVDGPIAALAVGRNDATGLLVVGKTGGVALLDPNTGKALSRWRASKNTLGHGALLPSGAVLLAGTTLSLHHADSGVKIHKWTGHTTPVTALARSPEGDFFASVAEGERTVAVWSASTTPADKLRHKSAVARLDLEEPAKELLMSQYAPGRFYIVVVTASGRLEIFECSSESIADAQELAVKLIATTPRGSSDVLSAAIDVADHSGLNLILATGRTILPTFQHRRVDVDNGGITVIELGAGTRQDGAGRLAASTVGGGGSRAASNAGAHPLFVTGPDEGVVLAGRSSAKRDAVTAELDDARSGALLNGDRMMESERDELELEEEEGPTLGDRVAALQGNGGSATQPGIGNEPQKPSILGEGPLKADSLAVLLSQALQSGDRVLLEHCLAVRNDDIITKTVKRLAPGDAATFIKTAVQRLQSTPSRAEALATWIRAVLLHHTAYLMGSSSTADTLTYLYQLIEARMASYQALLALNGRLELVLANVANAVQEEGGTEATKPLVTIEVGSDGEVEVEDAFAAVGLGESDDDDSNEEVEEYDEWESDDADAV